MSGDDQIRVERGGLGSIKVYEITDEELDALEKGEPNTGLRDLGLMLTPIGFAYIPVLILFEKPQEHLVEFVLLAIATAVSLVVGIMCLIIWWKGRGATEGLIAKIKARMKPALVSPALPPLVTPEAAKTTDLTETEGEASS